MIWYKYTQFHLFTILEMNAYVSGLIRSLLKGFTESVLDLLEGIQNMLTGAQSIFSEIGAGTIGVPSLPASQCNTVAFPGGMARDGIVCP
jgi:hypothetical protein